MGNAILSYPNWVDADAAFAVVSFDGGSWLPTLPLSNLRDRLLVKRARSTDVTLNATQFWVDLGVARDVRVAAIPFLTASKSAKYRIRGFPTQDSTGPALIDSGWKDLFPIVYPTGTLPWGNPSLWDGRMTDEDAAIFPMPIVEVWDAVVVARWWLIEIDDTSSDIGYVEVPRVFLAPGWQPTINISYGANQVFEPQTTVQLSRGGAEFFDVQPGRRVVRFGIEYLSDEELVTQVVDMQRRLGINGQVFWIFDPDDTTQKHRRSFLARMRRLSPLEYQAAGFGSTAYELSEVIA